MLSSTTSDSDLQFIAVRLLTLAYEHRYILDFLRVGKNLGFHCYMMVSLCTVNHHEPQGGDDIKALSK